MSHTRCQANFRGLGQSLGSRPHEAGPPEFGRDRGYRGSWRSVPLSTGPAIGQPAAPGRTGARNIALAAQNVLGGVAVQVAEESGRDRVGRWCAVAVEVLDRPEVVFALT